MKRFLLCVLVFALAAGAAFADPIGLRVYTDGLNFGNVAADNYELAGKNSTARFKFGIEYGRSFGTLRLTTALEDTISPKDPVTQGVQWNLSGSYGLQLAEASKLSFSLYNKLHFDQAKDFADQIWDDIGPGVRFDQTLGFGSLYAVTEMSVRVYGYENSDGSAKKLDLRTGENSGFQAGVNANFGLFGYVRPVFWFLDNGETPDDILREFELRLGYRTGPIEARVTANIPAIEDGVKSAGISIKPRFTYTFMPTLNAYAELAISALGKEGADPGFTPQIGASFSF
jgi:hypothetical protein